MKRFWTPLPTQLLVTLFALVFAAPLAAQQTRQEALREYQDRRRQAYVEYKENYRKACADFMRKRWEAFSAMAPVPVPMRREPTEPAVRKPDSPAPSRPELIAQGEVIEAVKPPAIELPAEPQTPPASPEKPAAPASKEPVPPKTPATPEQKTPAAPAPKEPAGTAIDTSRPYRFAFYGTDCSVSLTQKHRFRVASTQENSVANAWETVSGGTYDIVAKECREMKKLLNLYDWGYYELVRTVCDTFYGPKTAESTLLQASLMADAGYKIRLARGDGRLCLLVALDDQVYDRPYFTIDRQIFYILEKGPRASSYNVCNFTIAGERALSLSMPAPPALAQKPSRPAVRTFASAKIATSTAVNTNLMDFYTAYPPSYWSVYAATRLTDEAREQLYPVLSEAIARKSALEAANLLLHYLHQAFDYKTDEEQFGVERTLFAEEMFYYPFSDCEDRAILFARLVKDLLKMDAVLLYYPNHIATAICFGSEVAGDYVKVGAKRYVVCDPTYIGADVGEAMPELRHVSAQIVKID